MSGYRVLIGTPTREGTVYVPYVQSLTATLSGLPEFGIGVQFLFFTGSSIVSYARNAIAAAFRRSDATHLLFVDSDVGGWAAVDVARMLASRKDLVCGIYTVRQADRIAISNPREVAGEPAHLIEIDAAGGGFMLISRACLEAVAAISPETPLDHTIDRLWFEHLIINGCFQGEDFSFCAKYRSVGGRVFADRAVGLTHSVGTMLPPPSGNLAPLSSLPAAGKQLSQQQQDQSRER